ncbi:transmembrane protein 272-like [Cyprinodon tularosa]|uniref:transmembrane protein 272-like n=1 Tax=Cyprinodon tularosa TaxID=77115 RepID=UPI0018E25F11|nr:transmembrane protein 272-like [Cyprinodon tularosa]
MAAPSTGHAVTITVGTVWELHLTNPPPRTPRLESVVTAVIWIALTVARGIFGVLYFWDCPQQPYIPKFLLGMFFFSLMILLGIIPLANDAARPRQHPRGFKVYLQCFSGLFIIIWILLGDVWVFSVYQPNYDPSAADGLYCNKSLYTFAFWNALFETLAFVVLLARLCKGLLCYVNMSPVDTDFYRNV